MMPHLSTPSRKRHDIAAAGMNRPRPRREQHLQREFRRVDGVGIISATGGGQQFSNGIQRGGRFFGHGTGRHSSAVIIRNSFHGGGDPLV